VSGGIELRPTDLGAHLARKLLPLYVVQRYKSPLLNNRIGFLRAELCKTLEFQLERFAHIVCDCAHYITP